ncbi:MAG: signal recognition particle receptor subunit alpha, partial [Candidatus Acidiferrales bacterium]
MISLFGKPEKSESFLDRLKNSVARTRTELSARVEQLLTGDRPVDPALLAQLETALLSADIGVSTTKEVLASLRRQVTEKKLAGPAALKQELKNELVRILAAAPVQVSRNGDGTALP